jgi:hypothetical protein
MPQMPVAEDKPEGKYANYFEVGFNAYEFVIDFGQQYSPRAEKIHTRIVTSPMLAQSLRELLDRSLQDYRCKNPATEGGE